MPLLHGVLPALSCSGIPLSRIAPCSLWAFPSQADLTVATLYCCECNLCTMFACPEDLDPKSVCVQGKPTARERGLTWKGTPESIVPHPMGEYRRVPMRRLIAKLGLGEFRNEGPLTEHTFAPRKVKLPLKQHAGAPAVAVVKSGDRVHEGDLDRRARSGQARRADPCEHRRTRHGGERRDHD